MFERFATAARTVVVNAQSAAREQAQAPTDTGHLLLALLAAESSPAAAALRARGITVDAARAAVGRQRGTPLPAGDRGVDPDVDDRAALKAIGIDLDEVRRAIEATFGPGALQPVPADPPARRLFGRSRPLRQPLSPGFRKALELALREAVRLGHRAITPEHLLLGILRDRSCLAARVLAEAGARTDELRAELVAALRNAA